MPPTNTPLFQVGGSDIAALNTTTALATDTTTRAIAQVIQLDARVGRSIEDGELLLRPTRLRDRKFLGGAFSIKPDTASNDFKQMLDLWSLVSSTGVLISPTEVLMAGHAVIRARLDETYFVFGRTVDSGYAGPDPDGFIHVPAAQFRRAKSIVAIESPASISKDPFEPVLPDWAIVELDAAMDHEGLPLEQAGPNLPLIVYSHPFGVPTHASGATRTGLPSETSRLICDFASGGSGAPVIQNGKVVGVVSGNARFVAADISGGQVDVIPIQGPPRDNQLQPITPASYILSALANV